MNEIRFKYKDIIDAEIQVDGITTMSARSSFKEGVLTGGVNVVINGAPIGMGKQEISSIKVRVFLRNCSSDTYDIECLALKVKNNDYRYKATYLKAQSIFDALKLSMGKAKTEDLSYDVKSDVAELKELAILRSQGLITEEEFAVMKAKIINR